MIPVQKSGIKVRIGKLNTLGKTGLSPAGAEGRGALKKMAEIKVSPQGVLNPHYITCNCNMFHPNLLLEVKSWRQTCMGIL